VRFVVDKVAIGQEICGGQSGTWTGNMVDKLALGQGFMVDKVALGQGFMVEKVALGQGFMVDKVALGQEI
jgi:hypothetical protein